MKAVSEHPEYGLGISLKDGLFGIDYDDVLNELGELKPEVTFIQDEINAIGSYTEISPSKNGLHILAFCDNPEKYEKRRKRKDNTEIYFTGRFFTVTGNIWVLSPSASAGKASDDAIEHILKRIEVPKSKNAKITGKDAPKEELLTSTCLNDDEIIDSICSLLRQRSYVHRSEHVAREKNIILLFITAKNFNIKYISVDVKFNIPFPSGNGLTFCKAVNNVKSASRRAFFNICLIFCLIHNGACSRSFFFFAIFFDRVKIKNNILRRWQVEHILARVRHPQTNGKIERFFGELERRRDTFETIEEYISWHNELKPHMSLEYKEPYRVFWNKLPPQRIIDINKRLMNEA